MALAGALLALGMASLPFVIVSALRSYEPTPPPQGELTNERIEKIWARQLRAYERIGKAEDFADRAQSLIDRASQNGKDVSAVQAALDAFEESIRDAKPIYESAHGIVNAHQGFDSEGNVIDPEKAKDTVHQMGEKLKEIRDAMGGTGMELRDAIEAFREANPRPEKTPTP